MQALRPRDIQHHDQCGYAGSLPPRTPSPPSRGGDISRHPPHFCLHLNHILVTLRVTDASPLSQRTQPLANANIPSHLPMPLSRKASPAEVVIERLPPSCSPSSTLIAGPRHMHILQRRCGLPAADRQDKLQRGEDVRCRLAGVSTAHNQKQPAVRRMRSGRHIYG